MRSKLTKAYYFWRARFLRRKFDLWLSYKQVERDKRLLAETRAERYHRQTRCEEYFNQWKAYHFGRKAHKYYRWCFMRLAFANWAALATNADITCIRPWEEAARVRESTVVSTVVDLQGEVHKELAAIAAREEAQRHAEAYNEFLRTAAAAEEQARWNEMREEAQKKIHAKRLLQQQETARREAHHATLQALKDAFDARWKAKVCSSCVRTLPCMTRCHHVYLPPVCLQIDAAMAHKKANALKFIMKKENATLLDAEAKKVMLAKDLASVTQEYSSYKVFVSLEDGCIHFQRELSPEERAAGMPPIDINIDSMNSKEGLKVGADFYASRIACDLRDAMLHEKAAEWAEVISYVPPVSPSLNTLHMCSCRYGRCRACHLQKPGCNTNSSHVSPAESSYCNLLRVAQARHAAVRSILRWIVPSRHEQQ